MVLSFTADWVPSSFQLLMSDCLQADKIKLQAWLISATGVFSLSHNNMRDGAFRRLLGMITYSGLAALWVYRPSPTCREKGKN